MSIKPHGSLTVSPPSDPPLRRSFHLGSRHTPEYCTQRKHHIMDTGNSCGGVGWPHGAGYHCAPIPSSIPSPYRSLPPNRQHLGMDKAPNLAGFTHPMPSRWQRY